MPHEESSESWVVFDFADRYLADAEGGTVRPLEHYLALFPGHEESIRREHADLSRPRDGDPPPDGPTGDGRRPRVGPYRLLRELGAGGQARVWLAEDTRLPRKVALKVLGAALVGASRQRRERFRREAELVARLEHPGLCGVFEADLDAELPWIAMRYVEGETYAAFLARGREQLAAAQASGRPHPLRGARLAEALSFFERTARALHAAHEAGVVHRDVKPGNLMVASDGSPVVLDFGLAQGSDREESLTRTGEVFGTPAYMAPEQIEGREADRRTDVYALATVLFEAVTLRRPFAGASSQALARAIQVETPADPRALNPELPRDLSVVLLTALEKEPKRRYASALELADELRRVREFEPILARPVGPVGKLARWARRHPVVAAATAGSILVLSLALAVALAFIRELQAQKDAKDEALALYEGGWFRDLALGRVEVAPVEALQLAIEAAARDPGLSSNRALLASLETVRERARLIGHQDAITNLDVASVSGRIATSSLDGTARVWDPASGECLAVLRGHAGRVWSARFDPGGERVATASADGTARVWRWSEPAAAPLVLAGHGGEVEWAEFSPDGARIATASRDRTARVWNAATGEQELVLEGHAGNVSEARFLDGGERVLTSSGEPLAGSAAPESDHALRLFDGRDGRLLATLDEHTDAIRRVAIHPDGRRFLSASSDGTARFFDLARLADGALASSRVLRLPGYVANASFHPDGRRMALAFETGARVVDFETGETLWELPDHEHRAVIDIAWEPRGRALATAAFDNTVRLFPGDGPAPSTICRGVQVRPRGVAWAPDGSWLVSWHTTSEATVWYGRARPFLPVLEHGTGALASARFDPSGARVVTAGEDGRAVVFDARTAATLAELPRASTGLRGAAFDADGDRVVTTDAEGRVRVIDWRGGTLEREVAADPQAPPAAFLPDGRRVLFVDAAGAPALLDAGSGRVQRLSGVSGRAISFCASADGSAVACGTDARTVHLWRVVPTNEVLPCAWTFGPYAVDNHKLSSVYAVAASPDGRFVAAGTQHLLTYLLDAGSGAQVAEVRTATVGNLAFTRDGGYLLTTGKWTGFVRAWRVDAGILEPTELKDLRAWLGTGSIRCLARAPERPLVVAGSLDRAARLFDVESGECAAVYPGHPDAVWDVDFSPDGRSFVAASGDGTARIWPVDLLAAARAALPAGAKPLQREQFVPRKE